jgi:exonuclease SbcC
VIRLVSLDANNFKQLRDIRLRIPERGSILIEGRNEAGKSTLFEAVFFALFGKPLVADTRLEDLCAYDANEGIVLLAVSVEGRRLDIMRKIRRKGAQQARLRITTPDGAVEEVAGTTTVNRRLQEELRLDPDAFLNSCFVEQKKLEKLEGMSLRDRQSSLGKLLNLERFDQQTEELRVRLEDRNRVEHLRRRADLAAVVADIPQVKKRGVEVQRRLLVAEVKLALERLDAFAAEAEGARAEAASLDGPIEALETTLARINMLRQAVADADTAAACLRTVADQQAAIEAAERELADIKAVEDEQLPALRRRRRRLGVLRSAWSRIQALESVAASDQAEAETISRRLEELASRRQQADDLDREIAARAQALSAAEQRLADLEARQAVLDARQALEDWLSAFRAHTALESVERETAAARRTADDADAERSRCERRRAGLLNEGRRVVTGLWLAAVGFVVILAAAFGFQKPVAGALALLPAILFFRFLAQRSRISSEMRQTEIETNAAAQRAEQARSDLLRLEGRRAAAQGTEGPAAARLETATARLSALGQAVPASGDEVEARLRAAVVPDGAEGAEALRGMVDRVRNEVAEARGQIAAMRTQATAVRGDIEAVDVEALKARSERLCRRASRLADVVIPRRRAKAEAVARDLGVPPARGSDANRTAAVGAEAATAAGIKAAQERLAKRADVDRRRRDAEARIEVERGRLADLQRRLAAAGRDEPLDTTEHAAALRKALQSDLASLDEAGTRAQLTEHTQRRNRAVATATAAEREAAAVLSGVRETLRRLRVREDAPVQAAVLAEEIPEWADVAPGDRDLYEAEFEDLKARNGQLVGRKDALVNALGGEVPPDLRSAAEETAEMEAVVRDIAVRERAIRILDLARSSIMRKVMPYTLAHMRRILPALTMDRYHDAELTEDYKIRVWDERAGAWKSKNIFSGGTRDQFSLALRLAFAIATLPQERGSAPSFIFLDEPLSSFDAERSAALLYLLTQGEVAEAFDQILVISHSNSPAADGFQYRVRLEAGRVSEPTSEELRAADDALLLDSQSVLPDAASD